jgi:hypothetical protein
MLKIDSSDWSNAIRHHGLDTRSYTQNDGLQTSHIEKVLNHCTVLYSNHVQSFQTVSSKACDKTNDVILGSHSVC